MKCVKTIDDFYDLLQKDCTHLEFDSSLHNYIYDIDKWCEENLTGLYCLSFCTLIADNEEDLFAFKLRWM